MATGNSWSKTLTATCCVSQRIWARDNLLERCFRKCNCVEAVPGRFSQQQPSAGFAVKVRREAGNEVSVANERGRRIG